MSDEEFTLLKKGRTRKRSHPEDTVSESADEPYVRDEYDRQIDLLKTGPAKRRRKPETSTALKRYVVFGGVFTAFLAVSGQVLPAAIVAATTAAVALFVKLRR